MAAAVRDNATGEMLRWKKSFEQKRRRDDWIGEQVRHASGKKAQVQQPEWAPATA